MMPCRCNMVKAIIRVVRVVFGQLIMTLLAKQSKTPHIFFAMKLEKLGTNVYFTNSVNHQPQHHCDKKASIETTREQPVIVTSLLLAAGSCIDDVTIGKQLFVFCFNHREWWRDWMWIYVS